MAASAQTTIDLIFNGIDKTGAATQSALDNANKFTGSLKSVTAPIADLTTGALKIEAGLLAAGAAMTVFAVKVAGDFDASFRQITTLFDASVKEVDGFREAILKYAGTSTKPIEDIMSALSGAIGAGVDYKDSLALLGVAEQLAIATRADLTSTTTTLVSTLNAYGMKTSDAGVLADQFFQIIKDGKIEMKDLADGLARVTPLASVAGISMNEVGAAIATLTSAGVLPSEAIDGLRSAISNIIKPSEMATKLAKELGIEFDVNALKSKGFAGVLDDVTKATGGSADKMAVLFGDVTGLSSVLTLTGPQAANFKTAIASMGDSAGVAALAFEKMSGSLEVSLALVKNSFDGLMINIGTPLLEEFGGVAKAIAAIFTALGASVKDGALGTLVEYIEGQMQSLQQTLETVATNLPAALGKADLSGFTKGIDSVVDAFGILFGKIDLTTVDGLTRAIELAGAAFLGLSNFTAGVIESFKPLFDKLVEISGKVGGLDPEFFKLAGSIGGAVVQFDALLGGINTLLPILTTLVGLVVAKQGLSLVGGLQLLATTMPGVTAAIGVMAGAWGAWKIGELVIAFTDLVQANNKLKTSQEDGKAVNDKASEAMEKFRLSTGITVTSLDEMIKLHEKGTVVWDEATKSYILAGKGQKEHADATQEAAAALDKARQTTGLAIDSYDHLHKLIAAGVVEWDKTTQAFERLDPLTRKAVDTTGQLADAQKAAAASGYVPFFDAATGALAGYERRVVTAKDGTEKLGTATDKTGGSLTKIAAETKKAEDAQRRWNEELAKMDFEKSLKLIEQQTALMTSKIEADAKKTVAAFESIGVSVKSTGDVLDTLFGIYKDYSALDWAAIRKIEEQMDKENIRRDEAFKLQKDLTEAQIKSMQAQTDALIKGDGLIKISGDGLEPELNAFMWKILQTIQVKVNSDGLKMLLGA